MATSTNRGLVMRESNFKEVQTGKYTGYVRLVLNVAQDDGLPGIYPTDPAKYSLFEVQVRLGDTDAQQSPVVITTEKFTDIVGATTAFNAFINTFAITE